MSPALTNRKGWFAKMRGACKAELDHWDDYELVIGICAVKRFDDGTEA
jgi:hypothetical protein